MSEGLGLIQERRAAADSMGSLDKKWTDLSDELEEALLLLQQVAGIVLDEKRDAGSEVLGFSLSSSSSSTVPLREAMRSLGSGDYAEPVPDKDDALVPKEVKEELVEDTPLPQTFYKPTKAVPVHYVDLDPDFGDYEIPQGGLVMEVPNVVSQTVEAAAAAGIENMRLPAPVDHPLRDARSEWWLIYADNAARFDPGTQDLGVLERSLHYPSKEIMDTYAPPKLRQEWLVDPGAELVPGDRGVVFR